MASSASANKATPEKTNQPVVPLKCPRCGSSNTKFCYYNNYSLSQPRHLCRACKRYWTRGGTLRNVPVGGGCRKDKQGKRRRFADTAAGVTSSAANPSWQQHLDLPPATSSNVNNPLFYDLPADPMGLNFPVSRLQVNSARVCSDQMNDFGLGFSSSRLMASENYCLNSDNNLNGFRHIQDALAAASPPFFPISGGANNLLVGSASFAASSTSTMTAGLLSSGIQQQKFITNGLKDIQSATGKNFVLTTSLMPNLQMPPGGSEPTTVKEVNKMDAAWNPLEPAIVASSDHSSVPWNSSIFGAWIDPSTVGLASSKVPSLI